MNEMDVLSHDDLSVTCSSPAKADQHEEESGWTSYFEDLSNTTNSTSCSSSLLSDAASKFSHQTTTKLVSHPHPQLEDTATSPLNSPKVRELNPTGDQMSSRNTADQLYDAMGKGFTSEHNSEILQRDDGHNKDEMNFNGKNNNNEYTDDHLKKRGLCLVPLSMHIVG